MGGTKPLLQPEPSTVSTATEGGCRDLCGADGHGDGCVAGAAPFTAEG